MNCFDFVIMIFVVIWKPPGEYLQSLFHHEDHEGKIDKFKSPFGVLRALRG